MKISNRSGVALTTAFTVGLLGTAVFLAPARAQLLQGTIDGTVSDPSGAVIPGAKVVATDQATQFTRQTVTNTVGTYTLPDLPPSYYTITASATGFEGYKLTGVSVRVQSVTRVNIQMTVGAVNETVTISSQAATLQADTADVHSQLGGQDLGSLPVPMGRNYQILFVTIPGLSPPQNSHSFGSNSTRTLSFSVNGGNLNSNDIRVDGAGTRDYNSTDVTGYVPTLEAIEGVNIATGSLDADQSAGGGYINLTIKNGTNALHGSAFEDHTDRDIAAYQWAANRSLPKTPYVSNQFGGTIGGPIKRDKVFYFVSYEGTRLVQGSNVLGEVPTAAMKTGDLSASPTPIYDPMTGSANGSGRTPFPGNVIPAARIDPGVQALINTGDWPNPNHAGVGAYQLSNDFLCSGCQGSSGIRRDQGDAKVNWNPTTKLTMFARVGINDVYWYDPQVFGFLGGPVVSPANSIAGEGRTDVFNGTISATYIITPNLLVDAYVGYDRNDVVSTLPHSTQNLGWSLLQIPGLNTSNLSPAQQIQQGGMPYIAIDGFAGLGPPDTFQPHFYREPEKNYDVNLNWTKGTHNLRFGFEADAQDSKDAQYQVPSGSNSYIAGQGGFHFAQGTTQLLSGSAGNDFNAFASFLLGLPQDSGKIYLSQPYYYTKNRIYSAYVRDRWQIAHRLTVSYGLRWEYFPFPRREDTGLEYYNPYASVMDICGLGGVPADCGVTKGRVHAEPRLGIAYRLTGSTVIRAGYSLATDNVMFLGYTMNSRLNFPYVIGQVLLPPNSLSYGTTFRQGLPSVSLPNIGVGTIPVPGYDVVDTYNNANYVRGYVQSWNFTVQQQVRDWLLSAGYVGTRYIDPQNNLQMNWSPVNGGAAGEVLNQLTGRTASTVYLGTLGTDTYDGLQMRLQGHFGGLQMSFSYAFSKALGYAITPPVEIPSDYGLNRGPLATDVTQTFAATGMWELPFGKNKRWAGTGIMSRVAGGWQLSTVVTARTGLPFTPTASSSSLNSPFSSQFANCIGPPKRLGDLYQWYARSTFAVPATATFGSCGTDSLFGPGLVNSDLAVTRRFQLSERFQLLFGAEMFNVSNTPHFAMPSGNASVNSSSFMQVTSIQSTGRDGVEQRATRFSLRLSW